MQFYEFLYFLFYRLMKKLWKVLDDDPWVQAWAALSMAVTANLFILVGLTQLIWPAIHILREPWVSIGTSAVVVINYFMVARRTRRNNILERNGSGSADPSRFSRILFNIYVCFTAISIFAGPILLGIASRK